MTQCFSCRPFDSCINPSHPTTTDLRRVLDLQVFSQKYLAHRLQAYLKTLVEPLVELGTLPSHLNEGLSALRVFEVARLLNDEVMSQSTRSIIMDGLRGVGNAYSPVDAYDALLYAEAVSDTGVIGAAYYHILLSRVRGSAWDPRLSQLHIEALNRGRNTLLDEWQSWFDTIGSDFSTSGSLYKFTVGGRSCQQSLLHGIWSTLADAKLAPEDLIGKYQTVLQTAAKVRARSGLEADLSLRLSSLNLRMHEIFVGTLGIVEC